MTDAVVGPLSQTEIRVLEIWSKALGLARISLDDSFIGLGGSPIDAVTCQTMVRNVFGVGIPVACVYSVVPLGVIAALIRQATLSGELEMIVDYGVFRSLPDECKG